MKGPIMARAIRSHLRFGIHPALLGLVLFITAGFQTAVAQVGVGVPVRIIAEGYGVDPGDFVVEGTFLPSTPTGTDGFRTVTLPANYSDWQETTTFNLVRVEPCKSYTVFFGGNNYLGGSAKIIAPQGYRVIMNEEPRTSANVTNELVFSLQPLLEFPGLAGMATSISSVGVDWSIPLGSLPNGQSAGRLQLISPALGATWSDVLTSMALHCEPASSEVRVYRGRNSGLPTAISDVVAPQIVISVVANNWSSSFTINCFYISQVTLNSGYPSYSGTRHLSYTIEQGPTSTSLKITRESFDPSVSTSVPVRTDVLTLSRSGTWPAYTWTKTDWTLYGQTPLKEIVTVGASATGGRTESIVARVPSGATALSLSRTYSDTNAGQLMTAETVGTSNSLSGSFEYFTDTSQFANLGYVKSASLPGGKWVANEYYTSTPTLGGRIKYQFKPFLDSPSSVTYNTSQGEVTYYEYVNDVHGMPTAPSLIETRVNGVLKSKVTISYNYNYNYGSTKETRTEYASSGQTFTTINSYFRDASWFLSRLPYYSVTADKVQTSHFYRRGTWSGTAFTVSGSGLASVAGRVTGSSVSGSDTLSSTYSGPYTHNPSGGDISGFEPIYLVPGKSTMELTTRNELGQVVKTESYVYSSGTWQLVGSASMTYNSIGQLISTVKSNGATTSSTYLGQLKMSDTDETGVTTTYSYDVAGRLSSEVRGGYAGVGAVTTTYTYDAMDRVLSKKRKGWGQSEELVTTNQYDDAGRVTSETPPGLGATAHSYDVANRIHTVTRPDGSTVIEQTYRDGRPASKTGTGVVAEYLTYGVESDGRSWNRKDTGTSSSARWEKMWSDWLGKPLKKERPGFTGQVNIVEESFYDTTTGRLYKTTKTGFAPTRFEYDSLGQVIRNGLDVNDNGLVLASSDRITEKESFLESYSGAWWMKTEERKYTTTNNGTATVVSTSRQRLTGFPTNRFSETQSIDADGNVSIVTVDVDRVSRTSVKTSGRTGISRTQVETSINGLPYQSQDFDGLLTTSTYDALLRPKSVTDSRGNTTTTDYVSGTELKSTVKDATNQTVASFGYDSSGRVIWQADALGHLTRSAYNLRGQVYRQWGGATYPVEYGYDSTYGDRVTLSTFRAGTSWDGSTWPSSPGTADTTTFAFDGPSGMMVSKTDAQNRASLYTYNNQAQLATREWARLVSSGPNSGQRVKTTYTYDSVTGEQTAISYNDGSTPALSYTYNRLGLSTSITDDTGSRQLDYNLATGALTSETLNSTFYGSRKLTIKRDQTNTGTLGRITGYQVGTASSPALDQDIGYGYENFSRFTTLSTGFANNSSTRTFRYGYEPDSYLLKTLSVDGSPFLVSRTYEDDRDLVTSIESKWTSSSPTTFTKFTYTYDVRSQRSSALQDGAAFADYGDATYRQFVYNGRGEVTAAVGYLGTNVNSTSQPLPGRRYEYGYDNIGNRQWANRTGVTGLRDDYTANSLNQYVTRENNTVSISGTADASAVVAVNGRNVTAGRQGKFWSDEVTVSNVLNAWRGPISVYATKPSGGNALLRLDSRTAQTAAILESFTYDLDGNMVSDGLWDYRWDAENRLTRMETTTVAQSVGVPHRILEFRYDYLGRRVQKRVVNGTLSQEVSSRRFIYDGWNLIAEYTAPGGSSFGAIVRTFTWGLDIARSLSESGGVGALVQLADHATGKTFVPTYDGNGNIASMVNAATGSIAAAYEYSPYGEALRVEIVDVALADQPFRFSSKWTDDETGLLYYGRRFYDPKNGRFVGRDPVEEKGGFNLYGFLGNNPVNRWDYLGMMADEMTDISMDGGAYREEGSGYLIRLANGGDTSRIAGYFDGAYRGMEGSEAGSGFEFKASSIHINKENSAAANLAAILGSTGQGAAQAMEGVSSSIQGEIENQLNSSSNAAGAAAGISANVSYSDGAGNMSVANAGVNIGQIGSFSGANTGAFYIPDPKTSNYWAGVSPEAAGRAAGLAYDTQLSYANRTSPFAAIQNAGQQTFGNAVFQRPLTTLAAAGAQSTAVVTVAYAGVAAGTPAVLWFSSLSTEAKVIFLAAAFRAAGGDIKAPPPGRVGAGAFTQMRPSITQAIIRASKKQRRGPDLP